MLPTRGMGSSQKMRSTGHQMLSTGGVVKDSAFNDDEEHSMKLVYVEQHSSRRYREWEGFLRAAETFTGRPDIGPQTVFAPWYSWSSVLKGVTKCMYRSFVFLEGCES